MYQKAVTMFYLQTTMGEESIHPMFKSQANRKQWYLPEEPTLLRGT